MVEVTGEVANERLEGLLEQLAEILREHCEAYEDLRELLGAQHEALQNDDLSQLQMLLRSQEELVSTITAGEKCREDIQMQLYDRLDMPEDAPLLDLLQVDGLPGEPERRLHRLRDRLVRLTEEIRQMNEDNRQLLQQALKFVRFSLEGIRSLAEGPNTYAEADEIANALMMDRRA